MTQINQQQWPVGYGAPAPGAYPPFQPPAPTRPLTVTKWTTVGIVILMLPLMALWLMQGYENLEDLRTLSAVADRASGDGKGLKGGDDAIAWWEFLIIVEWATVVAVALLGVCAFLAGAGRAWARVLCTILVVFPIGVIVFGVIDSGPDGMWGLSFLLPFGVLLALWWRPATTRAIRTKAGVRTPPPYPSYR